MTVPPTPTTRKNRLISASKNGGTETYKYDAFNRQVSASGLGYAGYSIWDGWNLIINYDANNAWTNAYWHGPGGMLAEWEAGTRLCYSDASGSTTHLADKTTGQLLEWYRYDLHGTPIFYNASNTQISASAYGVRHLFTGQFWKPGLGLYDLRNRFYSPDIGRFLQADPIGFSGDPTNLYRYCGNNSLTRSDPSGTLGKKKADRGAIGDFIDSINTTWDGSVTGFGFGPSPVPAYDWTGNEIGMIRTEQYYASYPTFGYTYAMGVNGYGSVGGIIMSRPILKATDARTGQYGDGSSPGSPNVGGVIGGIADVLGKVWTLPNSIIGLTAEVLLSPFAIANGGGFQLGNNAIQLVGVPFGDGATTFGNSQIFFGNTTPGSFGAYGNPNINVGSHEQGHTYQYQALGPFFLPLYFLSGHPFSLANPFESAAQQYAAQNGPWLGGP